MLPFVKTSGLCPKPKTSGLCPEPYLENFWKSFLRTFKTSTKGDFTPCFFVVLILCSHIPRYEFRLLRAAFRQRNADVFTLSATG